MMNNWLFENKEIKEISDLPPKTVAFVYIITNKETGRYYIGQKILKHTTKKKLTQTEIKESYTGKGRKPQFKYVVKESDWKSYYGSNQILKEEVSKLGKDKFDRKIIIACPSKKLSTYYEVYYQFIHKCLEDPLSYNSNILGTFYKSDFELKEEDSLDI